MKIRRFVEKDSRTAMARVREALGAEAMILSNRRIGTDVEVVAALDLDEQDIASAVASSRSGGQPEPANELAMQQLQNELADLRNVLQSQLRRRSWRDSAERPAVPSTINQRLARVGLSRALGGALVDSLPSRGSLDEQWQRTLLALARRLHTVDTFPPAGAALACLGATGVGKTSVVAKLAGRELLSGEPRVALVSVDAWRIGGQEQLEAFAAHMNLPFEVATSASALSRTLRRFRGYQVFIDTAGMSQRDARLQEQWAMLRQLRQPVACCLVLSAVAQAAQTRELVQSFGPRDMCGAIITKLDEASSLGGVLDALVQGALPLAMISEGQRVPDDLAPAEARELVARAVSLLDAQPAMAAQDTGYFAARRAG